MLALLAATSGDVVKAGKALGFALTEAVVFYGLIGGFLGFVLVSG